MCNQVRSKRQVCLAYSHAWRVSWSGAAWMLPGMGSYSSLREPWMPTCTVIYWSRAWSPLFGDWAAGLERKVSNIHQLCDVVMEEWKKTPVATCEALVNSMPRRVKAGLENNGGHTKYWHFGHFHLGVYSLLWPAV